MKNTTFSKPVTAKQSRFIDEYMVDMNGAAAAERAGYSRKTSRAIACELLTKPYIQAELQARGAALARELEVTREWVARGMLDAFEMAKVSMQPSIMVSSLVALSKLLALNAVETKRVELTTGQDRLYQDMNLKSDAELLALIANVGAGGAAAH